MAHQSDEHAPEWGQEGTGARVSAPQPGNAEQDAHAPVGAADGRTGLRARLDHAIRPVMLLGLQDAELDGPGGTQRINEWADWIVETVLETIPAARCVSSQCVENQRTEEAEAAIERVRALAADMRDWCSPHGIAVDYAQRIDEALNGTGRKEPRQ